jgi:FMN phosphatase YigB (HAD superfamily)
VTQKDQSNSKIRALLFDFDGTLRHNDPPAHNFFFDQAVELGAGDSPENRRAALRWAHSYWNGDGEVYVDIERYGQGTAEFWLNHAYRYLLAFGCTEPQAEELAPLMQAYMREHYDPIDCIEPGAPALLHKLRDAGYILGVVSNRDEPFDDLLEALGLQEPFDFSLAAGEVGSWKPDALIFQHSLKKAGVQAAESVYIGDNYFADVVGARGAGLQPILFDPERVFPDAECPRVANLEELGRMFLPPEAV